MQVKILRHDASKEYFFQEGCYINELSNHEADGDLSIARARVEPGVTTRLHRLNHSAERYCILSGTGRVEVEGLPKQIVTAGDVVLIPPGCYQRISNTGDEDLIFLALCTPRFQRRDYIELDEKDALSI
ncbi:MAG: cupin domain-containing protein [Candidatus Thiodiazotropha endolucinida]|uniref:Cupin domain-containing protein n=1 Tax=Candidatus Thiodiazotropha taylori TaxID=2792791 RepID=A0A9E4NKP8_9GAMM|nr:cupin domain-containing protein [Candidatus Thiodiazotropha taylori]MBT3040109.1 cupin domain-containing protein [Candidatus Thiodiazotropha sp. (ex Codakia orbicularis)]MCG7863834.1 cupin domain-containing protein [Candidatus Thiodiazotropha endolucinida]MCG7978908.1 cupin domain-containing protein [Candidatus Thiodiazotropha taylori]MCW4237040.1 cupin domain-containing protein [Candidatus Thiodiazotropha endolucinida]